MESLTEEQMEQIKRNIENGDAICVGIPCDLCPSKPHPGYSIEGCGKWLEELYNAQKLKFVEPSKSSFCFDPTITGTTVKVIEPEAKQEPPPKSDSGSMKVPMSALSPAVLSEVAVAMQEGHYKYGLFDYLKRGASSSTYYDAAERHLMRWFAGEDIDEDSGLCHITKAISALMVLRHAEIQGVMQDDRPPKAPPEFFKQLDAKAKVLREKYKGKA